MKILGIIPARYGSTRFPGKPLVDIGGLPMVCRVLRQASQAKLLAKVVVATDDERIKEAVTKSGGEVILTSAEHRNGTERCVEALDKTGMKYDYVINIQGDEPFIRPQAIDELAALLDGKTKLATLVTRIKEKQSLLNNGVIKVVFNKNHEAIYFSRQIIPYFRGKEQQDWFLAQDYYKHVALYAYRTDILPEIARLEPTPLEIAESLEQLRWIENGYMIKIGITEYESISIDTPEDLAFARDQIMKTD